MVLITSLLNALVRGHNENGGQRKTLKRESFLEHYSRNPSSIILRNIGRVIRGLIFL